MSNPADTREKIFCELSYSSTSIETGPLLC